MLAIAGGKGGCGKTTTALGLARALAHRGRDPLVVDTDVDMPDLHLVAGSERTPSTDDIAAGLPVATTSHPARRLPGVRIVPAGGIDSLPAALDRLDSWDGPVLLDCPAGASRDAALPLRVSERTLLVTLATPQSIEDTLKTAAVARELDAPPALTLVRGDDRPDAARPGARLEACFSCPLESVPGVDAADVLADARFQTACQTVARLLADRGLYCRT